MTIQHIDPLRFRQVLGNWPSGVVVVTAMVEGRPVGMAINSFSSVSLDPPLVGFFPAKSSSTWPEIRTAGRFCVNMLAAHHEQVSRLFARKDVDRFAEISWTERQSGPALDEAVAWIDCEMHDEFETGDHTLALGRVQELDADDSAVPLLFHRGGYSPAFEGLLALERRESS